ncbi:ribosomal protein L7/L12 [Actinospica durhamensis]|uniref:Ribosomal protein L7/L12 n=1 Tax=Actinospica durhamensis TaxID=1508375 RepID=A0A941EQM4_9ACTN|nr:50S ribosomal protein L7/L12 [Actinospica durhamensis]MBR7834723.1 ribosomal protein L7/L12 [Actinospica durhamensis]
MDLETAQRIERLEYVVGMLCRQLGLNPDVLLSGQATLSRISDAVPPGYTAPAAKPTGGPAGAPNLPPEFYEYLRQGRKIQAIKVYREATGVGLKAAKDFVDGCS